MYNHELTSHVSNEWKTDGMLTETMKLNPEGYHEIFLGNVISRARGEPCGISLFLFLGLLFCVFS